MTERSRVKGKERIYTLLVLVCLEQGKLMSGADLVLGLRWAEFIILSLFGRWFGVGLFTLISPRLPLVVL